MQKNLPAATAAGSPTLGLSLQMQWREEAAVDLQLLDDAMNQAAERHITCRYRNDQSGNS